MKKNKKHDLSKDLHDIFINKNLNVEEKRKIYDNVLSYTNLNNNDIDNCAKDIQNIGNLYYKMINEMRNKKLSIDHIL